MPHAVLATHLSLPLYLYFPDKPSEDEKRASKSEVNDNDNSGKCVVLGKAGFTFNLLYLCSFVFKTPFSDKQRKYSAGLWLSECPSTGKGESAGTPDSWRNSDLCQKEKAMIMFNPLTHDHV